MKYLLSLFLCLLCWNVMALPEVILDTDIGDDIDDTWALMFLLGSEKVDLKLIVTACDDTETKIKLVAKMLERVGKTEIPIGIGVKTSDKKINQEQWIENYSLDTYKGTIYKNGVEKMVEQIRNAKDTVILCVIGPMMNIAKALELAPDIAEKARVVSMAGSVYRGYGGKKQRDCEYNICRDVESAKKVFSAPWNITIIPLDTCGTIILKEERYQAVENSKSPLAQVVIENYNIWTNRKHYPQNESSVLYDTLAIYCIWAEDVVEMKTIPLIIDNEGKTCPDEKGEPVRCAVEWKDKEQYETILIETLTGTIKKP
ncbi:MAG: nucleoside hydrolase [Candidatus Hydrogenedens sp.]|nr:nucleoside hydrolase [Candidatus Hydrogenedens sp.]